MCIRDRRRRPASATTSPSSENTRTPAAQRSSRWASSTPARPFVTAPAGITSTRPTSAPRAATYRATWPASVTGSVFGITTTAVYPPAAAARDPDAVSYTHLRAHETVLDLVCRLL